MDYAQQQRDPRRHLAGITMVIFLHAVAIYALTTGLARKVVDVLKKPLEVNIIEELKTLPPPPPPKIEPPPQQVAEPPPAYVPPPEVQVQAPQEPAPVITVVTVAPPPPVVVVAPPPPVLVAPPPPVANVGVACPNYISVLSKVQSPAQAQRMGLSGEVTVEFTVSASGAVGDVNVTKTSNRIFNAVAVNAVSQFRCIGQGQNVRVRLPIGFEQER
jgi:protein TonB